jgi:hypothetical protein
MDIFKKHCQNVPEHKLVIEQDYEGDDGISLDTGNYSVRLDLKDIVDLRNFLDKKAKELLRAAGKGICFEGDRMVVDPEWEHEYYVEVKGPGPMKGKILKGKINDIGGKKGWDVKFEGGIIWVDSKNIKLH